MSFFVKFNRKVFLAFYKKCGQVGEVNHIKERLLYYWARRYAKTIKESEEVEKYMKENVNIERGKSKTRRN